jgi:hypothetical protein
VRSRRLVAVVVGGIVVVLLAVAFRRPLAHGALNLALSALTSSQVSVGDFSLGLHAAELHDVHAERNGLTVVRVERIAAQYNLRDLLPGGTRRFGLQAVEIDRPQLTLHRNKDGSFDFGAGGQPPGKPEQPAAAQTPLRLTVRVRDGRAELVDASRSDPVARDFALDRLTLDATIDTAARTHYTLSGAYEPEHVAYRFRGSGTMDAPRGFALHELRAPAIPLREIANYFINNGHAASLQRGFARDLHFQLYSLGADAPYHIAGTTDLSGIQLAVAALQLPISDLSGRVNAFDDGLAAPELSATLNGARLRLAGGLFRFADPQIRLGVRTDASLPQLRPVFAFTERQPLAGDVDLRILLEGAASDPLILSRISSSNAAYHAFPIAHVAGLVAYYQSSALLVPVEARYGGIDIRAHGAFLIGAHLIAETAVRADAPAAAIPYAAQIIPSALIHATGLLGGLDGAFGARGIVTGSGEGDRIDGLFRVDPKGDGMLGPILAAQAGGSSVAGAFFLDREESRSAFWLDARRLRMLSPPNPPHLPGEPQVAPPPFTGVIDGQVAGAGPPSSFALAGRIRASGLSVDGIRIDRVESEILGSPTDARLGAVRAEGPWGTFGGSGAFDGVRLGLRGDYRGSFSGLEPFTGQLGATGPVAGPVSLLVGPDGVVVQTNDGRTPGATIHGVPFDGLAGTLATTKGGVRIYAAQARVARAILAAGGTLAAGGAVGLAIADIDAAQLSGFGLPLSAGRLSALGTAAPAPGGLRFDGGALIARGMFEHYPIEGNGDVDLNGATVHFGRVDGRVTTVFASGDGMLSGLGADAPRYDLTVRIRGADLGDAAAAFGTDRYHLDGSADADVHVAGAGAEPVVSGQVELPEATVNGLFIDHAFGRIRAAPDAIELNAGSATVQSTVARFSGAWHPRRAVAVKLEADRADLSDFNNFFDPGDLLAGTGHVLLNFSREHGSAKTAGDVTLEGLRYAHFDLGDAAATWTSSASRVSGRAGFGGRLGRLDAAGNINLATHGAMRGFFRRSFFDLQVRAAGIDVGAWLPALGYDMPVGGRIDAEGTLHGRIPSLALAGNLTVVGGTVGRLPIDRLTVTASSSFSRTTITDAQLAMGSISARASGSFGGPNDPLQLALHASSPNIGAVITELSGNKLPVRGSFEADVRAEGRPSHPVVSGGFEIEKGAVAGVEVPRALGEFGVSGRDVELRDVEVSFATGALFLAGAIPLQLNPFALGPPHAPITLEAAAQGISLSNFEPLLPHGSTVKGSLDGRVAVRGTVAAPRLDGALALTGGEVTVEGSDQPLRNVEGELAFSGTGVQLKRLQADAGSGSIGVTGTAFVPNLTQPALDATYDLTATFERAYVALPAFGRGQIDGTIALHRDRGQLGLLSGEATLQDAVIPFSALYRPEAGGNDSFRVRSAPATTPPGVPNVAFDLTLTAGRNVRVRSSVIDVGGSGTVHAGGTLAAPKLYGTFETTGGTLTYFNRVFRVVQGTVSFQPQLGIIPVLDARATAHVINPDPNPQRNLSGSADIAITVRGPVTNLAIVFESDPPYDQQQILALLVGAPALGTRSLFETPTVPGTPPIPGTTITTSAGDVVAQTAFGVLNAQFTRNLLAPFENTIGEALGLSSLNFTFGYTGNVGISARRLLGRNVYVVYGVTLGYPYRQTFGFELRPRPDLAAQFVLFQTVGVVNGAAATPVNGAVSRETLNLPIAGQQGFSFSLQRFLW